jgi:hypothetical protein
MNQYVKPTKTTPPIRFPRVTGRRLARKKFVHVRLV